jgi:hypothetical protein
VEPAVILEHHSLVVDKGVIVELLPHDDADKKYRAKEVVDQRHVSAFLCYMALLHCHLINSCHRPMC